MSDTNDLNQIVSALSTEFAENILEVDNSGDILTVEITPGHVLEVIRFLKENETCGFNYLTLIGAVHYPDNADREFSVVYHLHNWRKNIRIRVKAYLTIKHPEINSITPIFDGANWMERETYDFFGVLFKNHPDLRRILNEDSMDYFPMRKQYHLEDETREDKDDRYFGRQ
jgi:NADH-quinone oxidoreductase subunit C